MQNCLFTRKPTIWVDSETFSNEIKHHSLFNGDCLITFLEQNLFQVEVIDTLDFIQTTVRALNNFKLTIERIKVKKFSIFGAILNHVIWHATTKSNVEL